LSGILNISQPNRPSQPAAGIALLYFTFILLGSFCIKYNNILVATLMPVALSIQGSILFSSRKQAIGRRSPIDVISRPLLERRERLPQYLLEAFVCDWC
jgi:hypothetical protein